MCPRSPLRVSAKSFNPPVCPRILFTSPAGVQSRRRSPAVGLPPRQVKHVVEREVHYDQYPPRVGHDETEDDKRFEPTRTVVLIVVSFACVCRHHQSTGSTQVGPSQNGISWSTDIAPPPAPAAPASPFASAVLPAAVAAMAPALPATEVSNPA